MRVNRLLKFALALILMNSIPPPFTHTRYTHTDTIRVQDTRDRMLSAVRDVRAAFRYDVPVEPYKESGAFELIMLELWMRKLRDMSR